MFQILFLLLLLKNSTIEANQISKEKCIQYGVLRLAKVYQISTPQTKEVIVDNTLVSNAANETSNQLSLVTTNIDDALTNSFTYPNYTIGNYKVKPFTTQLKTAHQKCSSKGGTVLKIKTPNQRKSAIDIMTKRQLTEVPIDLVVEGNTFRQLHGGQYYSTLDATENTMRNDLTSKVLALKADGTIRPHTKNLDDSIEVLCSLPMKFLRYVNGTRGTYRKMLKKIKTTIPIAKDFLAYLTNLQESPKEMISQLQGIEVKNDPPVLLMQLLSQAQVLGNKETWRGSNYEKIAALYKLLKAFIKKSPLPNNRTSSFIAQNSDEINGLVEIPPNSKVSNLNLTPIQRTSKTTDFKFLAQINYLLHTPDDFHLTYSFFPTIQDKETVDINFVNVYKDLVYTTSYVPILGCKNQTFDTGCVFNRPNLNYESTACAQYLLGLGAARSLDTNPCPKKPAGPVLAYRVSCALNQNFIISAREELDLDLKCSNQFNKRIHVLESTVYGLTDCALFYNGIMILPGVKNGSHFVAPSLSYPDTNLEPWEINDILLYTLTGLLSLTLPIFCIYKCISKRCRIQFRNNNNNNGYSPAATTEIQMQDVGTTISNATSANNVSGTRTRHNSLTGQ